ncbi:hypothetical protein G5I_05289 [Acromyrmex echinatior]|uniref:Uncharacterized protein n=1 Tax=Acromyrmex echinatior TaxID=103372 RepID=F4WI20_ACREC|nr:hypothetical protein G5I_05289 [Acromyrmex echinatior]
MRPPQVEPKATHGYLDTSSTLDHLPVSLVLTFSVIAVSGLFTEGNLVCVQARVAGQGRHTHLRNNNGEVSDGVHPISVAAAAGRSASNDRAKCPQQYGKNMSYIINVRDGQDAHYLIANIYSSTSHFVEWLPSSVATLPWLKGYDIIETLLGEGSENDSGKASGKPSERAHLAYQFSLPKFTIKILMAPLKIPVAGKELNSKNVRFRFTNNTVFNRRGARRAHSAKYTKPSLTLNLNANAVRPERRSVKKARTSGSLVRARPLGRLIASTAAFRFARETPNGYSALKSRSQRDTLVECRTETERPKLIGPKISIDRTILMPMYQFALRTLFAARRSERALSTGNTIEGGLMEIKTPYRIPYVSQMAALDGVSYKHQPSLELFTCFLLDGPLQSIEKHCFFARAIINTRGNVEASSYAALRTEKPAGRPNGKNTALMNYETDHERRGRYRGECMGAGLRARARLISQSEPKNSGAIKWTAACTHTVLPVFRRKSRIAKCNPTVIRGEAVLRCGRL